MNSLFKDFSSRELAIFFWLGLLIICMLFNKDLRIQILKLIKLFFERKLFTIVCLLIIYIITTILILAKVHLWNQLLLKDTILWFFGVAFVLFLKINNAKNTGYFKHIVIKCLKWTIILEFITNFYTFSFTIELILTPIFILIGVTQAVAEAHSKREKKYDSVNKFLKNILMLIGFLSISFVLYKTLTNYKELLTIENLESLLISPILTIFLLPFLYLLAVWMNYEELFAVCINPLTQAKNFKKKYKQEVFKAAKLNLNKIIFIRQKINAFELSKSSSLRNYLSDILKKN